MKLLPRRANVVFHLLNGAHGLHHPNKSYEDTNSPHPSRKWAAVGDPRLGQKRKKLCNLVSG